MWTWPIKRLPLLVKQVEGKHLLRDRRPGRGLIVMPIHHANLGIRRLLHEHRGAAGAALREAEVRHGRCRVAGSPCALRQSVGTGLVGDCGRWTPRRTAAEAIAVEYKKRF